MAVRRREAFIGKLLVWGRENRRSFPWREEDDPFKILVAEVLLQRSRGKTVAKVYRELFTRWPDARSLSRARLSSVERTIRPLGLIGRAVSLRALAREVVDRGAVPQHPGELVQLPGVGRYAASATAAVAFHSNEPVVDSVTARVYRRYFGASGILEPAADAGLWRLVEETAAGAPAQELNWSVLDLAAAICRPKIPRCDLCPLRTECAWARALSEPPDNLRRSPADKRRR